MALGVEEQLPTVANELRRRVVEMLCRTQAGHPGGSLSAAEILAALYFGVLRVDPADPSGRQRDRFILSKGHAAPVYYAALQRRGFFPEEMLQTYDELDSLLQAHPDMHCPASTCLRLAGPGPLGRPGHGPRPAPQGPRLARLRAARRRRAAGGPDLGGRHGGAQVRASTTWWPSSTTTTSSSWATRRRSCRSSRSPTSGAPSTGTCSRSTATTLRPSSRPARPRPRTGPPTVIIAHTVKGKGVSFMENTHKWHSAVVTDDLKREGAGRALTLEVRHDRVDRQRDAFGKALVELGATDERVVAARRRPWHPPARSSMFEDAYPRALLSDGHRRAEHDRRRRRPRGRGLRAVHEHVRRLRHLRATDQIRVVDRPAGPARDHRRRLQRPAGRQDRQDPPGDRGHRRHARPAQHDGRGAGRRRRGAQGGLRRGRPPGRSTCASPATPVRWSSTRATSSAGPRRRGARGLQT